MVAPERLAARSVHPLLTTAAITLLGVAVSADVTGLLAPASVWATVAIWNLAAASAVGLASVAIALIGGVATPGNAPSRRADFIRDLTLFATVVAASLSLVWRLRGDTQLPPAPAVLAALVSFCGALVAAFLESD